MKCSCLWNCKREREKEREGEGEKLFSTTKKDDDIQEGPNHRRVVCKMEAQSERVHVAYTFSHVWTPTCMLSR